MQRAIIILMEVDIGYKYQKKVDIACELEFGLEARL